MLEGLDLFNVNSVASNESDVQHELNKSEPTEKSEDYTKRQKDKCSEINNYPDNNTDCVFNKYLKGEDVELPHKSDENLCDKTLKEDNAEPEQKNYEPIKDIHSRLFGIIDSDSEHENFFTFKSKHQVSVSNVLKDEGPDSDNKDESERHDSCDSYSIDNDSGTEEFISNDKKMQNRFQSLIDSESDEEERIDDKKQTSPIKYNKKAKGQKNGDFKLKAMKVSLKSSKEEALRQIQSETQRLIRESEVSLPYHKPKQRTLQEFLRRKKVITALPKAPTMAAKLKMSSAIVNEVLKEKEKEAEIFYQSSNSEDDTDEINNKPTETECIQGIKKDKVSKRLFVGENFFTPNFNTEKSSRNTVEDMNENLALTKRIRNGEAKVNDAVEKNTNNLITTESYCESDDTENKNLSRNVDTETVNNDKVDDLWEGNGTEKKIGDENLYNDNSKGHLEMVDDPPDITPKHNNDYANVVRRSLGLTTDKFDEYNEYGLPPPNFGNSPNINEKKAPLNIINIKPKLQGAPGTMIDLSNGAKPGKTGINVLIDRYVFKHSMVSGPVKDISEVTTTCIKETPNGVSIVTDVLPYRSPSVVNENSKLQKPGAKLLRLKQELKHKMALKREEEWKQREQELKEQVIEWNESVNEDDNLDEPFSASIDIHRSEENELEEDGAYERKGKKKKKSAFMDGEAEVSEDEMDESDEIEDEEDELQKRADEDVEKCDKLLLEEDDESSDVPVCKTFKRIIEPLDDDSSSSNGATIGNAVNKGIFDTSFHEYEQFSSVSQIHRLKHPTSQTSRAKNNTLDFVSPVTQLTALNTDLEEEKDSRVGKSLFIDPILIGSTQSQALFQEVHLKNQCDSRKTLFNGQGDALEEKLMDIASGKVSTHFSEEPNVSESQLLELCSGTFSSEINDTETIDFAGDIHPSTQVSRERDSVNCKKDEPQLHKRRMPWNRLRVVSSDDEDVPEGETVKRLKKEVKILDVSDVEEENESLISIDEEENENDNEKYVDYDSEENEIVIPKKEIKNYAANFLDEEAELSESDCDVSADEDEKDLDKLEFEDGDDEEIDETQVKDQLGKLHMRRLLDEDQKEVRMLQEFLFEDGDLYTESGRERKFKWKNIDKQVDDNDPQPFEDKDGWVDLSDDEDEAKWRKIRHEREKFLAEKMVNDDSEIESDMNESQVFKFGLKILKKRRIDESQKRDTLVEPLDCNLESRMPHTIAGMLNSSELNKKSGTIHSAMQKRSFLARGEESLARLATLARQKEAPLLSKAKNFVFAHIDVANGKETTMPTETTSKHPKVKGNR